MHNKQWSSRPSLSANERLTDVCLCCNVVTQNVHHMTVSSKWIEVQKFAHFRGISKLCHDRCTWYMTSEELVKVTGVCCWESFQLLTWTNVQICTWQPFAPYVCVCGCVCVCVCDLLQVVTEYCTADSSAERQWEAFYEREIMLLLFYYTYVRNMKFYWKMVIFLNFFLQIWQGHLNTALYSAMYHILPVHILNASFFLMWCFSVMLYFSTNIICFSLLIQLLHVYLHHNCTMHFATTLSSCCHVKKLRC
jgi:hypothetical protein